jgi:hypothetical protein
VKFIVGEVERERWPSADIARLSAVGEVLMPPDLAGPWNTIRAASLFIGNDGGPARFRSTGF